MPPRIVRAIGWALSIAGLFSHQASAWAQNVQIGSLTDMSFGTVASVTANQTMSQTLCVFTSTGNYTVRATGSGPSNAFTLGNLANSAAQMPYTVQWASSGSQTSGTPLTAGQGTRFTPNPLNLLCSFGSLLAGAASLVVTLPAASLSAAQSGNYTGTLTLLISPN
jgi:hypothetical protein